MIPDHDINLDTMSSNQMAFRPFDSYDDLPTLLILPTDQDARQEKASQVPKMLPAVARMGPGLLKGASTTLATIRSLSAAAASSVSGGSRAPRFSPR